ncbi:MAG: alkaline phosphatase family protein [FCB group bacterium]|nr:alkaline phosphatase family protein [FCB group bacterium]
MQVRRAERVLIIGLDCATPQFLFGPDKFDLPNLEALRKRGAWGLLRSCDPPITVPAWACMTSSKDPGQLGIYGFRNRKDYSYDGMTTANGASVKEPRVWDILSRAGKKVAVVGVPQTYPVKPVNGWLTAGFLAPDKSVDFTYPKTLKQEVLESVGDYIFDVKDFRTHERDALLERIQDFMENRFAVVKHLLATKPWDFFMMVEMGVDRMHHAFWRFTDKNHPDFEPGNKYENVLRDYYQTVDKHIGEMLSLVGDETNVFVVSDHGARGMYGGVCINQWLIQERLLTVRDELTGLKRIEDCDIDWSKTKVWGSGGYYGRLFFNVKGREADGQIEPEEYESFRDEVIAKIEAMVDHEGKPMGNKAHKPEDLYKEVKGIAPDLIVYFGDLGWRSVGTVGFDSIYTFENDTGPDDANHDFHGIFLMDDRTGRGGQEMAGLQLMDIAPTVLEMLGVDVPADMLGRTIR